MRFFWYPCIMLNTTGAATLTAATGLPATGGPYQLQVGGGLQDVSQRSAVPYELSLFSSPGN